MLYYICNVFTKYFVQKSSVWKPYFALQNEVRPKIVNNFFQTWSGGTFLLIINIVSHLRGTKYTSTILAISPLEDASVHCANLQLFLVKSCTLHTALIYVVFAIAEISVITTVINFLVCCCWSWTILLTPPPPMTLLIDLNYITEPPNDTADSFTVYAKYSMSTILISMLPCRCMCTCLLICNVALCYAHKLLATRPNR
jgi:hypothetical protein